MKNIVHFGYNSGMLTALNISNIVLIEKLNLEFGAGLNILTGETGAGKSILLDALSLALGARSDAGLVRSGCDMASVVAEFDSTPDTVRAILTENGIDSDDNLILRRTLSVDGKSRAWINDTPVSVRVLHDVGDALVEIHGQFANHRLLNQSTHRAALDEFAIAHIPGFADLLADTRSAYNEYHAADLKLRELRETVARAADERDFLEHNVAELRALNVRVGEESELADKRTAIMNAEKNAAIVSDANSAMNPNGKSLDAFVFDVAHILERVKTDPNPYAEQIEKLYEVADTLATVSSCLTPDDMDVASIDEIEERLFAIRAAARKHRVPADELPQKLEQMSAQLEVIDNSDAALKKLAHDVDMFRTKFDACAAKLSAERMVAADKLRTLLRGEFPDLKLGNADFMVERAETNPTATGVDDVTFMIKTNPGSPFAPLHKSASGGELARLMLAMRVVLITDTDAHTFVFDEVDTGISGATASAVGLRLNKLAQTAQALVVTHSAQVAGFADYHFKIEKSVHDDKTTTTVREITGDERVNEVARIISGAEITPESIATAKTLIK
ncbi:MAG: DNA repair protein RecN [Alphaproteobacteria bacterium]|nr:DNA repair protein RecN [Alphaproteobacteria bacterium]